MHAHRAPGLVPVARADEHARDRIRAGHSLEDADLVVDEVDVGEVRVDLGDRGAQRALLEGEAGLGPGGDGYGGGAGQADGALVIGVAAIARSAEPTLSP